MYNKEIATISKGRYMRPIFFILLFVFVTVSYADEPIGFKEFKLGSDMSLIEKNPKFRCVGSPNPVIADEMCHLQNPEDETIATVPLKNLSLLYFSNKLEYISIKFSEDKFDIVVASLKGKYGEGKLKTVIVRNRVGTEFENKIFTWKQNGARIDARRYQGKLDEASVTYMTDKYFDEYKKRKGERIKKGESDL